MTISSSTHPIGAIAEYRVALIRQSRETADAIARIAGHLPPELRPLASRAETALHDLEVDPVFAPQAIQDLRAALIRLLDIAESTSRAHDHRSPVVEEIGLVIQRIDEIGALIVGLGDLCTGLEQALTIWAGITGARIPRTDLGSIDGLGTYH